MVFFYRQQKDHVPGEGLGERREKGPLYRFIYTHTYYPYTYIFPHMLYIHEKD